MKTICRKKIGACESCLKTIREGDKYHQCTDDVYLCEACAPSYQDMLEHPADYMTVEGRHMTFSNALAIASLHKAQGGKLSDKVVS